MIVYNSLNRHCEPAGVRPSRGVIEWGTGTLEAGMGIVFTGAPPVGSSPRFGETLPVGLDLLERSPLGLRDHRQDHHEGQQADAAVDPERRAPGRCGGCR